MDKIAMALSAAEDNAAAVRELGKTLERRVGCTLLFGTTGEATSFGNVYSSGRSGIVVTFTGGAATLTFCGDNVVTSQSSPIIAVLPAGNGELKLTSARQSARALIIGQ